MAEDLAKGRLRGLSWTPSTDPRDPERSVWTATTEIAPGGFVVVQLRGTSDYHLERYGPLFEEVVTAMPGLVDRLTARLVGAWHEDDPEEQGEEDIEEDEEAIEPAEPPGPKPERVRPGVRPVRISLGEGSETTVFFQVSLPGHEFVAAVPNPLRAETAPVEIAVEYQGHLFELVDLEAVRDYSRPGYRSFFKPNGHVWMGAGRTLCPRPTVEEREGRIGFREAIAVVPAIFAHVGREEPTLEDMADFVLDQGLEGPWWDYELDDKLGDDDEAHDCEEELDEDAYQGRVDAARRRQLLEILPFSGGPEVILFADGSGLASCSHRTSFKSDVFAIELSMDPDGEFIDGELRLIYRGDY